jgi:uncharacterized Fe-S cluster-containing protein
MGQSAKQILEELPGNDCGMCGYKTCALFAESVALDPTSISRCTARTSAARELPRPLPMFRTPDAAPQSWTDRLGREYDFVLEKFDGEPGPKEQIVLFNPTNVERLGLKKGDIIYGRPAWISCGCPLVHCGVVMDDPDYFNGTVVWCIVGPLMARKKGINIGYYSSIAYEGLVRHSRTELQVGRRYNFQPRYCMLQWRHCGLVNFIQKNPDGGHKVRIEGLWIG